MDEDDLGRIRSTPMPRRIAELARTSKGVPIPYFVGEVGGRRDFRVLDHVHFQRAVVQRRCFICGQVMGKIMCAALGPMCTVNRVSSEPPSHRDCVEYALQVCPFLTQPDAVRREANLPQLRYTAGNAILTNPGVTCLWPMRSYEIVPVQWGHLFRVGEPCLRPVWWTRRRLATRGEVLDAFRRGYPALRASAAKEGGDSIKDLLADVARAMEWLPPGLEPALLTWPG